MQPMFSGELRYLRRMEGVLAAVARGVERCKEPGEDRHRVQRDQHPQPDHRHLVLAEPRTDQGPLGSALLITRLRAGLRLEGRVLGLIGTLVRDDSIGHQIRPYLTRGSTAASSMSDINVPMTVSTAIIRMIPPARYIS